MNIVIRILNGIWCACKRSQWLNGPWVCIQTEPGSKQEVNRGSSILVRRWWPLLVGRGNVRRWWETSLVKLASECPSGAMVQTVCFFKFMFFTWHAFLKFSPPKNSKNVLQKQAFLFLSDYPVECTQTPTGVNQEMKSKSLWHSKTCKHV